MPRGRPKIEPKEEQPKIFERRYVNDDGTTEVWKFNLNKFENGPIETIVSNYPSPPKNQQKLKLKRKKNGKISNNRKQRV